MTQSANSGSGARAASRERRRALSASGKAAISHGQSGAVHKKTVARAASVPAVSQVATPQAAGKVSSGKAASKARRYAMSSRGKAGAVSADRSRTAADRLPAKRQSASAASVNADAKKGGCGCGCNGENPTCQGKIASTVVSSTASAVVNNNVRRQPIKMSSGRAASFARRTAMSKRGKAGISGKGLSVAQTARAANPSLSSRELSMVLREQRSRQGRCGQKKSEPCGRIRPNAKKDNGAAQDAPWKVGASETSHGQTLTGTMVGRSQQVTGDEPSTCRDVTGTEYLGAEMFRDFCQTEPSKSIRKVDVTSTTRGNAVSGNKIGRGDNVTGNETGSCKHVTGNEYLSSNESEVFCGSKSPKTPAKISLVKTSRENILTGSNVGRSEKVTGDEPGASALLTGSQYTQPIDPVKGSRVPDKVGSSQTLRGGQVSGSLLDRTGHVTGNEAGSCRNVTGDDYTSQESFKTFCESVPQPKDNKVGMSATNQGNAVTGVMTSRSQLVTGNEPGTCKSVTGTPYASADQLKTYCETDEVQHAIARNPAKKSVAGSVISGKQPAVGGTMTGDNKGACEAVSGTPYVGADQFAQACPTQAADVRSADFPQPLGSAMLGAGAADTAERVQQPVAATMGSVTGSSYEKGNITGPFGMATGKVTGTEQARFGGRNSATPAAVAPAEVELENVDGRAKSRISGEGMDTTSRITGNDWGRGKNVTGTEGASAIQRNPTFHASNVTAPSMAAMNKAKRNDEVPVPVSKVTGSSGNTEQGSLVTYSGGARG